MAEERIKKISTVGEAASLEDGESLWEHLGCNKELDKIIKEKRNDSLETGDAFIHMDWAENLVVEERFKLMHRKYLL